MILLLGEPIRKEDEAKIRSLKEKISDKGLTFILVYDKKSKDSFAYCRQIEKFLGKFDIPFEEVLYEGQNATQLLDPYFEGQYCVVLAKPLPEDFLFEASLSMNPQNDPDCLSEFNKGEMLEDGILPATAQAVMRLFDYYKIDVTGKKCLVIGRSKTVGFPIAVGLLQRNGLVSIAHSKVPLPLIEKQVEESDVVVLASGKEGLVKQEFFNKNQIVIDCGYHAKTKSGDLGFIPQADSFYGFAPVPGGVGPLTISTLVMNALRQKAIILP